jgi:hypothetical protein
MCSIRNERQTMAEYLIVRGVNVDYEANLIVSHSLKIFNLFLVLLKDNTSFETSFNCTIYFNFFT